MIVGGLRGIASRLPGITNGIPRIMNVFSRITSVLLRIILDYLDYLGLQGYCFRLEA